MPGAAGRPEGPAIILVEPQLGENIGMAARAMANFGLRELRLVAPRDGWPNPAAAAAAAGATGLLDAARVYPSTAEAVADLHFVLATSARSRGQMKRVLAPDAAMAELAERGGSGQGVGILFGRERTGLENDDISLADALVTFPVDPTFASLNLAQAVLLVGYEWTRARTGLALPFAANPSAPPASRASLIGLFEHMEAELDAAEFYPADKKPVMSRNMRDMFHRMSPTEQDVRTWRGAIRALAELRRKRKA
ncbi:RNA methyltransferase [Enterovirga sp. CN4-39]|uniref:RNA methyltransferase n=1 Tax=Enterovirga sp. CN4-39 TaxID=3400910 RepID=UPI003C009DAC